MHKGLRKDMLKNNLKDKRTRFRVVRQIDFSPRYKLSRMSRKTESLTIKTNMTANYSPPTSWPDWTQNWPFVQ